MRIGQVVADMTVRATRGAAIRPARRWTLGRSAGSVPGAVDAAHQAIFDIPVADTTCRCDARLVEPGLRVSGISYGVRAVAVGTDGGRRESRPFQSLPVHAASVLAPRLLVTAPAGRGLVRDRHWRVWMIRGTRRMPRMARRAGRRSRRPQPLAGSGRARSRGNR